MNKPSEIAVTLSGTGTPANLGRMALETGVLIDGEVADDLAIFVTGSGSVQTSVKTSAANAQAQTYGLSIPD